MFQNGTLNELINIINKKKVEVIYFDAYLLFMPGMPYNKNKVNYYKRKKSYGYMSGKNLFSNIYLRESFSDSACLMMIDRVWLNINTIRFIEGIIYEDCIFSIQVMMKANRAYHINKQYYIYRIRANSTMTTKVKPINLYSRIICYRELIKIFTFEQLTIYQQKAIFKFIKMIERNIKKIKKKINKFEWKYFFEKKSMTKYEKILLNLVVGFQKKNNNKISPNIKKIWKLFNSNNIEIYGIDNQGINLFNYFNLINKTESIKGFIDPNSKSNKSILKGKNIKNINDDKNIKKNEILIIAGENEKEKEINKLKDMGYKNIIILDKNLKKILSILFNN